MHYSVRYCAAACALSCGMLPDGRHPPTHTRTHGGSPALPLPYPCRPLPPAPPAPQIITGALLPDGGEVIKAKESMKIAYLTQEFDVVPGRTLREEFMSAFGDQMQVGGLGAGAGSAGTNMRWLWRPCNMCCGALWRRSTAAAPPQP